MTQFEFVLVFISMVLALGVSDILANWGAQIRFRDEVRPYWLHTVWGVLYLLAAMQVWWGMWRLKDRTEWNFIDNIIQILPYLLLSLIAYVMTPSIADGQRDVKAYYYKNAGWIFGLIAVFIAGLMLNTYNVLGTPAFDVSNLIRGAAIAVMICLAVFRNERLHIAAVVVCYALLAAYIANTLFSL